MSIIIIRGGGGGGVYAARVGGCGTCFAEVKVARLDHARFEADQEIFDRGNADSENAEVEDQLVGDVVGPAVECDVCRAPQTSELSKLSDDRTNNPTEEVN